MSPTNQKYISQHGNWKKMIELLEKHGKLVCKSNEGTGGKHVFLVSNQYELENAVYSIFRNSRSLAISPYYDIENEYRIIILEGEIKLVYTKQRPYIVGDGVHTVKHLLLEYMTNNVKKIDFNKFNENDFNTVLNKEELFFLNWKHNLGQGAYAKIEDIDNIKEPIKVIVDLLVKKMNIRFASIDIVNCNNEYRVLEINSGVMMEHFSRQSDETYRTAKRIYREAIFNMLNSK